WAQSRTQQSCRIVAHWIGTPSCSEGADEVLKACSPPLHGHIRGLELIGRPALAQTGDHTARAEVIESRESTRQNARNVEERVDDARAELDPLRLGGDEGERLDRIVDVGVVRGRGPAWKGRVTRFDRSQQPFQRPNSIVVELFSFAGKARDHLGGTLLTVVG